MSSVAYTTKPLVSASILAADFGQLGSSIEQVEQSGADWIHLDVMDGHFVPNITIGPQVIRSLRSYTRLPFDVHLMIDEPERYLENFKQAGADLLTVHARTCQDLYRALHRIRDLGLKAGVSLSPATPLSDIEDVLDAVDLVLLMSVSPGFGGQSFIPTTLNKLTRLKQMLGNRPVLIEVDGGITLENAAQVRDHGAQVLVSGTTIFQQSGRMSEIIEKLRSPSIKAQYA